MNDWISVNDRLPDEGVEILYYFEITGVSVGMFERPNIFYGRSGFLTGDVTHWMPLPEPPK